MHLPWQQIGLPGVALGDEAGRHLAGQAFAKRGGLWLPTRHAWTHQTGGSDIIKLDDLGAPDDNTDLNASTTAHGLLKKLANIAGQFMDSQGNWNYPSIDLGGACSWIGSQTLVATAQQIMLTPTAALGTSTIIGFSTADNGTAGTIDVDWIVNNDTTRTNYYTCPVTTPTTSSNNPLISSPLTDQQITFWFMMSFGVLGKPMAFFSVNRTDTDATPGSAFATNVRHWIHNDATDVTVFGIRGDAANCFSIGSSLHAWRISHG